MLCFWSTVAANRVIAARLQRIKPIATAELTAARLCYMESARAAARVVALANAISSVRRCVKKL